MPFDFFLMMKMLFKSVVSYGDTGLKFTPRRIAFLVIYPVVFLFQELITWTCLLADDLIYPDYRKIEVKKPLFIVGFPRSGTTYLHRLIDCDEQFTSLKMWELMLAPSILQKKFFLLLGRLDRRMGQPLYRLVLKIEDKAFAGSRRMHRISHFEAEEDELILLHIFSSAFLYFMFPFEEMKVFTHFDTDVPAQRRRKVMRFYKKCVQRHLFVFGPDKRFLSKNPASSGKIESIYETFPDAKIACMVRNPLEAVPSAISWMSYGFNTFNTDGKPYQTERIMSAVSHWYSYPLLRLDARDENQRAIKIYDELVADPAQFVRELYGRFDYHVSEDFAGFLAKVSEKSKNYKSGHDYSLDQFELTRERIVSDFSPIFERFGFPKG